MAASAFCFTPLLNVLLVLLVGLASCGARPALAEGSSKGENSRVFRLACQAVVVFGSFVAEASRLKQTKTTSVVRRSFFAHQLS